jgi:excisionase family DNA binding protein
MKTNLKVEDIAKIFNVHPATVRRWANQKKIKATKIGKYWFFPRDVVDNL